MKKILAIILALTLADEAGAVIFLDTADPQHNTTTPGDNSGWQYEGKYNNVLGVPIAPNFFITAAHTGGAVGNVFNFHGDTYTTIAFYNIAATDLRIWKVNLAKPFPTWAPLSTGVSDVSGVARIIGRGVQRGPEIFLGAVSKGWGWGTPDLVQRWGSNVIVGTAESGKYLYCDFNKPGIPNECHLGLFDSGGGMFVLENGLWRLAGINYGVDGPIRVPPATAETSGAYIDLGGLEYRDGNIWIPIPEAVNDIPSSFYCSRIAASTVAIQAITGSDGSLASESYSAWQRLYFAPAEIANTSLTGPNADFDSDGIMNLLEFALNLEPGFNARTTMIPSNGISGLPVVRLETLSGADHLSIEFVRRTAASGSGLTYIPQFSSDATDWLSSGSVSVTAINPRWERVKVIDPETTGTEAKRFARLKVVVGS